MQLHAKDLRNAWRAVWNGVGWLWRNAELRQLRKTRDVQHFESMRNNVCAKDLCNPWGTVRNGVGWLWRNAQLRQLHKPRDV